MQTPSEQPTASKPHGSPALQIEEQEATVCQSEQEESVSSEGEQDAFASSPTAPSLSVVGLGGSAGAVEALCEFFQQMSADSGMAFVIVIHLPPGHNSTLAQQLQPITTMRVVEVSGILKIEPNTIYVIPPSAHLSLAGNQVCLLPLVQPHGKRVAVDLFFRSLADTYGQRAIGIILSGTDGDGSIGLKRIKERGGLTIAQEPFQAQHEFMPRSAIATGMVDWILPVQHMPSKLIAHQQNEKRLRLPTDSLDSSQNKDGQPTQADEIALREVFSMLQVRTGHDFTHYKRATVLRRISRRLQVNHLPDIPSYLDYLRTHPGEIGALLHDLLISVTNFFRDPKAFEALEQILPSIFKDKTSNDQVRVWVAGCATGEEAYSIAILLTEYAEELESPPAILIFATDLSEEAIHVAREGKYPETIAADVSPERLQRFFTIEPGCYRIRKDIRKNVLFAVQNLIKDAPFSRLDLVSCRNLLIYLNREAQRHVFDIFHFALRSEGILFLGTSESIDDRHNLFVVQNKEYRLYTRAAGPHRMARQISSSSMISAQTLTTSHPFRAFGTVETVNRRESDRQSFYTQDPDIIEKDYSALHLGLLERYAPPSIVIDSEYNILHLSQNAGRFLLHTGGQMSSNLLTLIHPSLRQQLGAALTSALHRKNDVRVLAEPIVSGKENSTYIHIHVRPVFQNDVYEKVLILVLFEEVRQDTDSASISTTVQPVPDHLQNEIQRLQISLHSTADQYQTSVEELKASNEALQAINEEARFAAEELEIGKEELQAVNEELTTVNLELKNNIEDLARANSDMQNLMVSSEIATIFLDRELLIKRYTPRAAQIFNLIPTDTERPISHITHRLDYPGLVADVETVLTELKFIEREVESTDGQWFLARLLPYRAEDNYIDGVILTLIDITRRKQIEADLILRGQELQRVHENLLISEQKYRTLFNSIHEAFCVMEMLYDDTHAPIDCRILESNPAFERLTGLKEVQGKTLREILPDADNTWIEIFAAVASTGDSYRFSNRIVELGNRWYDGYAFRLDESGSHNVALIFSQITGRKRKEHNAAFLASIADDLTQLSTIDKAMQAVSDNIGSFLNLSACVFLEINDDANEANALYDWHPKNAERLTLTDHIAELITQELKQVSRRGECFTVDDTASDSRITAEKFAAENIAAFVHVPIISNGVWKFSFIALNSQSYHWRGDEIELMRELIARVWAGIERLRNEEALRESEERLRLSIEASNAFTWEINIRNHQSKQSANVRDVLGFDLPADTREIFHLIYLEDRQHVVKEALNAMQGKSQLDVEHRIINPATGSLVWVRVQGVFIPEDALHPSRFLGITQNITDRKLMAEALTKSEERYRIFIEGIEDYAIFMTDLDARITSWNSGVERVLGYSEEEFIGQPASIIFTPEDRNAGVPELELEIARLTGRAPDERWHLKKDGSRFYASGVMTALQDENGNIHGYAKILRDMTDRKRMEEELEARVKERTQKLLDTNNALSNESAQRLELERTRQQLLERIVSTQEEERHRISRELHDQMGQQLTALLLGLKSLPSALDESALANVGSRLESLQDITNGLMDQVHNLAWELRPAVLDNLGLEATVRQYAKQWSKETGVSVDCISSGFAHSKRLSPLIETTLYRVIQESLANVQRHAQAEHVSILLERIREKVVVIIEDDGKGFDFQIEDNKKTKGHGAQRLGLIGMRERMELIGGTLTIESESEGGTSVYARVEVDVDSDSNGLEE